MDTVKKREALKRALMGFLKTQVQCDGVLEIGSGAEGYRDQFSDVDMMVLCKLESDVKALQKGLTSFLKDLGAFYIEARRWSQQVLGLSAYFEDGLGVDISIMPTSMLYLRSRRYRILYSVDEQFAEFVEARGAALWELPKSYGVDDSLHHKWAYALRRCEIALRRGEWIYAEMALGEARRYLLLVEAAREGKPLHQFKAYQSLDTDFLVQVERTYPRTLEESALRMAAENLQKLYIDTVNKCSFLRFDPIQLKMLTSLGSQAEEAAQPQKNQFRG